MEEREQLYRLMTWQNKKTSAYDVICPWCECEQPLEVTWNYDLGHYSTECQHCHKPFEIDVTPIYKTYRPESMYQEGE